MFHKINLEWNAEGKLILQHNHRRSFKRLKYLLVAAVFVVGLVDWEHIYQIFT